MAKLYFKFGAMGSSKTAQALMTKFNYEEKNKSVLLIKPATDNRDDRIGDDGRIITEVRSRIGLFAPATAVSDTENLIEMYLSENKKGTTPGIPLELGNNKVIFGYIFHKGEKMDDSVEEFLTFLKGRLPKS